jgi:hypothetical protein
MPHPPALAVETKHVLTLGQAARILHERCPACFGLEEWGHPLEEWVSYFVLSSNF